MCLPIYVQYVRLAYKLCLIHSVSCDCSTNNIDEFCAILSKFLSSNFIVGKANLRFVLETFRPVKYLFDEFIS